MMVARLNARTGLSCYREAWREIRPRWARMAGCLFLLALPALLSLLPMLSLLSWLLAPLCLAGVYRFLHAANGGQALRPRAGFSVYSDWPFLRRMIPYLLYSLCLSACFVGLALWKNYARQAPLAGTIPLAAISLISTALTYFSLRLITLEGTRFAESLRLSWSALKANLAPIIVFSLVPLATTCVVIFLGGVVGVLVAWALRAQLTSTAQAITAGLMVFWIVLPAALLLAPVYFQASYLFYRKVFKLAP